MFFLRKVEICLLNLQILKQAFDGISSIEFVLLLDFGRKMLDLGYL